MQGAPVARAIAQEQPGRAYLSCSMAPRAVFAMGGGLGLTCAEHIGRTVGDSGERRVASRSQRRNFRWVRISETTIYAPPQPVAGNVPFAAELGEADQLAPLAGGRRLKSARAGKHSLRWKGMWQEPCGRRS
jgi:hypothetical protein